MTEQEALDKISDDWVEGIDPTELGKRANEMWSTVVIELAREQGIRPSATDTIDNIVIKLAKAHKVSNAKELQSLKNTCLQNAKIDIFTEKYGYLFEQDEYRELSYSLPVLRKITGLAPIPFNGLENKTKKCDIPAYRHHTV